MARGPLVVTVSDLRRRLAALIDEVDRHGHPLFVTQYGLVTAVLVSAERVRYVALPGSGRPGREAPLARASAVASQNPGPRTAALD